MKRIDLHQVDAFTDSLFGGNPAGVVTDAEGLEDDQMQNIAREMNVSETAFVFAPTTTDADVKLRYFTPNEEVKFCGHATVGTLFTLARLGMNGLSADTNKELTVETNAGLLNMSVGTSDEGNIKISFTAPNVDLEEYNLQGDSFARSFGISADSIYPDGKIYIDTFLNYLYIPITSLKELGDMEFDYALIKKNFTKEDIVIFCLYSNETLEQDYSLHARGLAPIVDVEEDPFTGSMQAGLILSAKKNGLLDEDVSTLKVEQGHFIGRPGKAEVTHTEGKIRVSGTAVHVFSTNLELPYCESIGIKK